MPLILTVSENVVESEEGAEGKEGGKSKVREIISWDADAILKYNERTKEICRAVEGDTISIEEKWEKIKKIVLEAMVKKKVKMRKRKLGDKDWWDKSCTKKKREVVRIYKRWRNGKVTREERLMQEKKELKALCERKQRENREKEEKELRNLRKESEIWKYINKRRNRRKINENIKKEEWRRYFMELLEGKDPEGAKTEPNRGRDLLQGEGEQITEEEIKEAVKRLKSGKAARLDAIPMEAWKYGGKV